MNPIWCRMKKRSPSSEQNSQLVHWWLLVHSGPVSGGMSLAYTAGGPNAHNEQSLIRGESLYTFILLVNCLCWELVCKCMLDVEISAKWFWPSIIAKSACFHFSSSNLHLQGDILSTSGVGLLVGS
jgi:hypothetical protein